MAKNTTPALPVWIQDLSLEDIGRRGGSAVHVYVHGFWGDVMTLYVRREYDFAASKAHLGMNEQPECYKWKVEMTHSSGGRDTGEVASDLDAHVNFAQGVLAGVQRGREILAQVAELEAWYQKQQAQEEAKRAELKAEAEKAEAEKAAAADPALGEEAAAQLVAAVAGQVNRRDEKVIVAITRGASDKAVLEKHYQAVTAYSVRAGRDGVVRFFKAGCVISRSKAIEELATYSHRTHVA